MFNRHITNRFLSALAHIKYGHLTVTTPDGRVHTYAGKLAGATAELVIHDWRVVGAMILHGDIALAEAYRDGQWDTPDLTQLFVLGPTSTVTLLGVLQPAPPIFSHAIHCVEAVKTLKRTTIWGMTFTSSGLTPA